MIVIDIRTTLDDLRSTLGLIERQAIPQALPTAINRTGRQMESYGVKLVARAMGSKQSSVRRRLVRKLARMGDATLELLAYGGALNISSFSGTMVKRGRITQRFIFTQAGKRRVFTQRSGGGVSSRAWGKSRVYPHTFLIHEWKVAMKRIGKARFPIRPVYGPGIRREFERHREQIEAEALRLFPHQMDEALRAALAGYIK